MCTATNPSRSPRRGWVTPTSSPRSGRVYDEPYAELYRRHQPAALALARTLTEHTTADDIVSEAFEKLLQRIRGGGGPEAAFRPYLLRTVRTVAVDASRRTRRLVVAEDPEDAGRTPTTEDDALVDAVHERTTLARAFAALPERWQTFLWLSFVDGADRHEIATILGINVGSVSALGYRAREGLRRAYLDAHLRERPHPECADVWPLLAGAIRGGAEPGAAGRGRRAPRGVRPLPRGAGRARGGEHPVRRRARTHRAGRGRAGLPRRGPAAAAPPPRDGGRGRRRRVRWSTAGPSGHRVSRRRLAGLGKTSAAGVAVMACVSTVAVVALLAFLTAPAGLRAVRAPRPGAATSSDGGRDARAVDAATRRAPTSRAPAPTPRPAVATSSGEPTSSPTDGLADR